MPKTKIDLIIQLVVNSIIFKQFIIKVTKETTVFEVISKHLSDQMLTLLKLQKWAMLRNRIINILHKQHVPVII